MDSGKQINGSTSLEQYWNEQIKLKCESDLSRVAYCRKHGLSCTQFGYWETKLIPKAKLLPVKLATPQNPDNQHISRSLCTVTLKNGIEIKVHDKSIVPALLSVLS
jgi:hypothetical protein